jgi:hypothetical protein
MAKTSFHALFFADRATCRDSNPARAPFNSIPSDLDRPNGDALGKKTGLGLGRVPNIIRAYDGRFDVAGKSGSPPQWYPDKFCQLFFATF